MSLGALFSKPKKPLPPANQPFNADASVKLAGDRGAGGYGSFISTSSQGLTKKAATRKASLISGGSS
jgi:hypothetical protein